MSRRPLADYRRERELVHGLLADGCKQRILLFRGESGVGKTSLLRHCLEDIDAERRHLCCPMDLRSSSGTSEILSQLGHRVGWDRLANLSSFLEASRAADVNIENVRLLGKDQQINVALTSPSLEDREHRLVAMTDHLFRDLADLPRPVLVAMDHFEQATDEISRWIDGPFLRRVANVESVRVLLAGQRVPDPESSIDWGRCCQEQTLFGVREAEDWLPVVEAKGRMLPTEHPTEWLAGVCHVLDGNPSEIVKVIDGLPRREDVH